MHAFIRQAAPLAALAVVFGLCLSSLVNGLAAGAIDGPVRGIDAVFRDSRPLLYWSITAALAAGALASAIVAVRLLRQPRTG